MKSLYPGQKVSSVQGVFDFLAAHSINLTTELAEIVDMLSEESNHDPGFLMQVSA